MTYEPPSNWPPSSGPPAPPRTPPDGMGPSLRMPGSSQPPGWYPDPSGAPGQRWWDGTQWGGPFGQSPPPVGPSPGSPNPWQRFRALPKAAQVVSWVVVVFVAMGIIGSIGGGGDDDDD